MSDISHEGAGFQIPAAEKSPTPVVPAEVPGFEHLIAQAAHEEPHLGPEDLVRQQEAQAVIRQAMEQAKAMPPMENAAPKTEPARAVSSPGENQAAIALQKAAAMIKAPFTGIMNLLKMIGRWIVK